MPFFAILTRGMVEDVEGVLRIAAALAKRHDVFLQPVAADVVYNERHLASAHLHADRAIREGRATGHSLGAEFLMYLTGQRQVARAIDAAGIRAGQESVIVVAGGDRAGTAIWGLLDKLGWSRQTGGIPVNPAALAKLGVQASGAANAEESVLERVALLDLDK